MIQKELTRREFLKGAFALLLTGCGSHTEQPPLEVTESINRTLLEYYPELQLQVKEDHYFRMPQSAEWVYLANYTDKQIDWISLEKLYAFYEDLTKQISSLDYVYGSNHIPITVEPRSGVSVHLFIPQDVPLPNWPNRTSEKGGTLVIPESNINLSFTRFDPSDIDSVADANKTVIVEACQAKVQIITSPNPLQEITCNSMPRAFINASTGNSFEAYQNDALNVHLNDPNSENTYPLVLLPEPIYVLIPHSLYDLIK